MKSFRCPLQLEVDAKILKGILQTSSQDISQKVKMMSLPWRPQQWHQHHHERSSSEPRLQPPPAPSASPRTLPACNYVFKYRLCLSASLSKPTDNMYLKDAGNFYLLYRSSHHLHRAQVLAELCCQLFQVMNKRNWVTVSLGRGGWPREYWMI